MRSLNEDEVVKAASTCRKERLRHPGDRGPDPRGHPEVIAKDPNPEEINQVAGRLASVGWPLVGAAN